MSAQRLSIESRRRDNPTGFVRLDDFTYQEGEDVDPQLVVEQPNVSLYCLDHDRRRAIFVEAPPDVDLTQAPFYYQAQHAAARSLIAVPYDTLRRLADDMLIDARRLILIYSPGRCGSTLVSSALAEADGVLSLSEPDVYTELVDLRQPDRSNTAEVSDLVRDCTRIICGPASRAGATACAIKFRSFGIELGDLLFQHFPTAKVVFLYRNAEGFARSSARAFDMFAPENLATLPRRQRILSRLVPQVAEYTATHSATISSIELLVCRWVSAMQRCSKLQQQGVPMFCMRYEELKQAPRVVLDAMFTFCGVSVRDPQALEQVLARDSQAGTNLSQANARQSTSALTEEHVRKLHELINHYDPQLTADTILPHTFLPDRT